jgi:hypothetical protein
MANRAGSERAGRAGRAGRAAPPLREVEAGDEPGSGPKELGGGESVWERMVSALSGDGAEGHEEALRASIAERLYVRGEGPEYPGVRIRRRTRRG